MTEIITYSEAAALPGIRSRFVKNVNGLTMHLLEAGFGGKGRPCVLLLHGFPEIAYSWRKVMLPIASAGFYAAEADIERVQETWRDCLARSGGPWLFGAFGIADAMFAPVALRFVSHGVEPEPDCADYVRQVEQLPAIQEWLRDAKGETEGHGPF